MENLMRFRHNVMNVNSIAAFEGIRGGVNQNCKDVYFIRLAGVNDTLVSDVREMDRIMKERMRDGHVVYRRLLELPAGYVLQELPEYEGFYREWTKQNRKRISGKVLAENTEYAALLGGGLKKALEFYALANSISPSMEKNFVIKMLYWHDYVLKDVMKQWDPRQSVKIVLSNIVKKQEYLFACFLTFLGCDVLLLQSESDLSGEQEAYGLSRKVTLGSFAKIKLPDPAEVLKPASGAAQAASDSAPMKNPAASNPVSAVKPSASKPISAVKPSASKPVSVAGDASFPEQEKTFEQLALLASSVVLIGIHDRKGDMIGTGSGIMIGSGGYILTNSHVAAGGSFYTIRIEEDETVYSTDELIKCHSVLDLAVLRIERALRPLPIYSGRKKLVRGQKVVAIGSPLGLFNSVSDGIISGFRKIDGVDMIQFTAPTSHGSSGGALLNMYGEVIGISTAGFDNAQNINLAVGYESIVPFIRGFT